MSATSSGTPPPACPEWCAGAAGHPYTIIAEDGVSPQRLHWYPVGFVQGDGGGPARVSLSSVETSTGGIVELSPMIVTVLTGATSDDSCYLELTPADAVRLSWLLGDAARLIGGQPADPWLEAL